MKDPTPAWPLWHKAVFRFIFIYYFLFLGDVALELAEGLLWPIRWMSVNIFDCFVNWFNDVVLQVPGELSTCDGTLQYVKAVLYLLLAAIGSGIWSAADRKRSNYRMLQYILWTGIRYFVAYIAFLNGVGKLYLAQTPFPSLSEAATPLGDFPSSALLPILTSHAPLYQVFLGSIEILICFLLLYRRTVFCGILVALAVYTNALMLSLGYGGAGRNLWLHIVVSALLLLLPFIRRIAHVFIYSRHSEAVGGPDFIWSDNRMKLLRVVLTAGFLLLLAVLLYQYLWVRGSGRGNEKPFAYGVYSIEYVVLQGDTIAQNSNDSLAWKDFIFDRHDRISVKTSDPRLQQLHGRGYMNYKRDSIRQELTFTSYLKEGKQNLGIMKYYFIKGDKIMLEGIFDGDSLSVAMVKNYE